MVDRWLYEASLEASEAIRSKMSETKELRIAMALLLYGSAVDWPWCVVYLRDTSVGVDLLQDLVDVRRVRLDSLLGSLLSTLGLGGRSLSGLDVSRGQVCYNVERTLAGALEAPAGALEA